MDQEYNFSYLKFHVLEVVSWSLIVLQKVMNQGKFKKLWLGI